MLVCDSSLYYYFLYYRVGHVDNNIYNYMELLPFLRLVCYLLGHGHSTSGGIKVAWIKIIAVIVSHVLN